MSFSSPDRRSQSGPAADNRTARLLNGVGTLLVAMVLSLAVVSSASAAGVGADWVEQTSGITDDLSSVFFTDS